MATSQITLYYATKDNLFLLTKKKNFVVENIENWLSERNHTTLYNYMYQKNKLTLEVKLDLSQVYSEPLYENGIRYVRIVNSDENRIYYYFVDSSEWRSRQSVKLTLSLDTLNTFKYNEDYILSSRTNIKRQHKDRLETKDITSVSQAEVVVPILNDFSFNFYGNTGYKNKIAKINQTALSGTYYRSTIYITYDNLTEDLFYERDDSYSLKGLRNFQITNTAGTTRYMTSAYFEGFIWRAREDGDSLNRIMCVSVVSDTYLTGLSRGNQIRVSFGSTTIDGYYLTSSYSNTSYYYSGYSNLLTNQTASFASNNITFSDASLSSPEDSLINAYNNSKAYAITGMLAESRSIEILGTTFNYYSFGLMNYFSGTNDAYINALSYESVSQLWRKVDFLSEDIELATYKTEIGTIHEESREVCSNYSSATTIDISDVHWFLVYLNQYDESATTENPVLCYCVPDKILYAANSTSEYGPLSSIETIDRTNTKIIKIIALPYAPFNYSFITPLASTLAMLETPSEWELSSFENPDETTISAFKLKEANTSISSSFTWKEVSSPISNVFVVENFEDFSWNEETLRNDNYEGKIYHSDFYILKFVYDSFNLSIPLQNIDTNALAQTSFSYMSFTFTPTTTINSKFMFSIDNLSYGNNGCEDYDFVAPCARNNEEVLYNNSYITYLRTGYNYDVKSINNSNVASRFSAGAGIAKLFTEGASAALSLSTNFVSTWAQTENRQNSLEKNLTTLQSQTTSVRDSNDIDLLRAYSDNRAKMVVYKPISELQEMLNDLFYYYGYKEKAIGVPNLNSRYRFNYIEADIELDYECNMDNNILDTLIKKWNEGITFLHEHNGSYDIEQVKENLEVSIIELL